MELVRWAGSGTVSELRERFGDRNCYVDVYDRFERWCKTLRASDDQDFVNRFLPPLDVIMVCEGTYSFFFTLG